MSKPSIPQGTRDFSPSTVRKRQYILNVLKTIFESYGYQPLETPAMENLNTLMGKYGDEGDKLIFRILDSGNPYGKDFFVELFSALKDYNERVVQFSKSQSLSVPGPLDLPLLRINPEIFSAFAEQLLKDKYLPKLKTAVGGKALRYDLTIPFARYVAMNQNDIAFPFRRYQMQPVWRGDSPQKGRYREFWQCDADIVGSRSLINEAELLCIYREAFYKLNIPVKIKINSRKVLAGIAEYCGAKDRLIEIASAIDKYDKIHWHGVEKELKDHNFSESQIQQIRYLIDFKMNISELNGESTTPLDQFEKDFLDKSISIGLQGIKELKDTIQYHKKLSTNNWGNSGIEIDFTLARGLNYYTGIIVEVVCNHPTVKMGSIGGGGRYDDLTASFGVKNLETSGVGISFGIDRIYDVIEELGLFPQDIVSGKSVMLVNFGGENEQYALQVLKELRSNGITVEIYPDAAKFDKQMKYANKRGITYVILPGDEERQKQMLSIKNFATGEQQMMSLQQAIAVLK